MYQSTSIKFNPIISIDSSTFTGSYIAFGTGFTYPVRLLHIVNKSNEDVLISFDGGYTDHLYIAAGSYLVYDFGTNRGNSAPVLELAQGSPMMIKGTAGAGDVYCMSAAAVTPTMTIPGA
jgi:hypothetical protein